MRITQDMLRRATDNGLLREGQATALWTFLLAAQDRGAPRFAPAHILYYLGGLTAIGAMSLFITLGWERLGGGGLLAIALAFALAAAVAAEVLLYIFGVLTFWGGLTSMESHSELGRFASACVNLLLIAVGSALSRRAFAVFGAIGVALYLGHLSHTVFRDSLLFPLALASIGLAVMAAGVAWQRRKAAIGARLRRLLPDPLRELIEQRAAQ